MGLGHEMREQRLRCEALSDSILKIPNRNALEARKRVLIKRNAPHSVGAIYLDVNGLQRINDSYGHAAGDRMLRRAVDFFTVFFRANIFTAQEAMSS